MGLRAPLVVTRSTKSMTAAFAGPSLDVSSI
jgi:hypothetical protein